MINHSSDQFSNIGIKLTLRVASDVHYFNSVNLNTLVIEI